jgi:hypothetical protein
MDRYGLMFFNGYTYPEVYDQRQYQQLNSHIGLSRMTSSMVSGGFSPFGGMYPNGVGIMGQAGLVGGYGYGYSGIGMNGGPYGLMGAGENWTQPYCGSMVNKMKKLKVETRVNLAQAGASFNGKCYFCGRSGHRKVDCVRLKKELQAQVTKNKYNRVKKGSWGVTKSVSRVRNEKQKGRNLFSFEDFEEVSDVDEFDCNRVYGAGESVKLEVRIRGLQGAKTVLKVDAEGGQEGILVVSQPVDDEGLSKSEASVLDNLDGLDSDCLISDGLISDGLISDVLISDGLISVEKNSVDSVEVDLVRMSKNCELNCIESVEKSHGLSYMEQNKLVVESIDVVKVEKRICDVKMVDVLVEDQGNSSGFSKVDLLKSERMVGLINNINPWGEAWEVKELGVIFEASFGIGSGDSTCKVLVEQDVVVRKLGENVDQDQRYWVDGDPMLNKSVGTKLVENKAFGVLWCPAVHIKVREGRNDKLKSNLGRVIWVVNGSLGKAKEKQRELFSKFARNSNKYDVGDLIIVLNSRNKPDDDKFCKFKEKEKGVKKLLVYQIERGKSNVIMFSTCLQVVRFIII